jgi:hypothetical protein
MLGKAAPKIGDRVDELVGNIQKKLCGRERCERVREKRGAGVRLRPQVRS